MRELGVTATVNRMMGAGHMHLTWGHLRLLDRPGLPHCSNSRPLPRCTVQREARTNEDDHWIKAARAVTSTRISKSRFFREQVGRANGNPHVLGALAAVCKQDPYWRGETSIPWRRGATPEDV